MNRRDFGKLAVIGTAVAAIAPNVLAKSNPEEMRDFSDREIMEESGYTPEQIAAVERMHRFESHVRSLLSDVVKEFPQAAPDTSGKSRWKHGSFRVLGWIGSFPNYSISGNYPIFNSNTDISDIRCIVIWRQSVRNRHTQEVKGFAAWSPTKADSVVPGQSIAVGEDIRIGTSDKEIADIARKSLAKLQELVVEFYNAEA